MIVLKGELTEPPSEPRALELWLQHAAGYILFRDVGDYARTEIDPSLDSTAKAAAEKAINDALYGVMMVLDGVTGDLRNENHAVALQTFVRLVRRGEPEREEAKIDLFQGDGMCMGYHYWIEGNFGENALVK